MLQTQTVLLCCHELLVTQFVQFGLLAKVSAETCKASKHATPHSAHSLPGSSHISTYFLVTRQTDRQPVSRFCFSSIFPLS